jgi:signal transduction histidine kinase
MVQEYAQEISPRWSCSKPRVRQGGPLDTEKFLQRIVDACASYVAALDQSGRVLCVSRAWRLFAEENGFTATKDAFGFRHLQSCNEARSKSADEGTCLAKDIQQLFQGQRRELHEEYVLVNAASPKWFLMRAARVDMRGSGGFTVLVTLEDITRRRQAEEELRYLGGRLISVQEEERSRIARELHDDLNQRMALLSIEMEQLGQKIPRKQHQLRSGLQALWTRVQEISGEIHRLSYQLHPSKLDHLGLASALNSFCEELSARHEIRIEFRHNGFPAILPDDITLCVFRIGQEGLRNVIKHSGARRAQVVLERTEREVRLRVLDAGSGFDPQSAKTKKGLGLISMRERLRLVGGKISIKSQPEHGTEIDVVVPLAVQAGD